MVEFSQSEGPVSSMRILVLSDIGSSDTDNPFTRELVKGLISDVRVLVVDYGKFWLDTDIRNRWDTVIVQWPEYLVRPDDEISLEAAWELVKSWTREEREHLRRDVPRLGLDTPFDRSSIFDVAAQAVGISEAGLVRRNRRNDKGQDETIYLAPLEETIRTGMTPAQRWLEKFHGEWGESVLPIFKEAEI